MPEFMNMSAITLAMRNSSAGINQYLGINQLPYSGNQKYHHFKLTLKGDAGALVENFYFNTETLKLEWLEIEGQGQVVKVLNGFEKRNFTDADFSKYTQCSAKTTSNDSKLIETFINVASPQSSPFEGQ